MHIPEMFAFNKSGLLVFDKSVLHVYGLKDASKRKSIIDPRDSLQLVFVMVKLICTSSLGKTSVLSLC
jgi:hypothetical protein